MACEDPGPGKDCNCGRTDLSFRSICFTVFMVRLVSTVPIGGFGGPGINRVTQPPRAYCVIPGVIDVGIRNDGFGGGGGG